MYSVFKAGSRNYRLQYIVCNFVVLCILSWSCLHIVLTTPFLNTKYCVFLFISRWSTSEKPLSMTSTVCLLSCCFVGFFLRTAVASFGDIYCVVSTLHACTTVCLRCQKWTVFPRSGQCFKPLDYLLCEFN